MVIYKICSLMLTYPCSPHSDFISQDGLLRTTSW